MGGQFVDDDGRRRSAQRLSMAVWVQCGTARGLIPPLAGMAAEVFAARRGRRQGQFAPVDINFKAWIPTAAGIELHFPEFQFGGGLKVVTVSWATVTDQIRPEFTPIMGG
jgi:hypothetical protein